MEERPVEHESSADALKFGQSLAGTVSADQDLSMSRSGALLVKAGRDLSVSNGGAAAMVAGGNSTITNGGGELLVVGGNAQVINGGAQTVIVGGNATFKKSLVFAVISRQVSFEEGSRALLNTQQAIIFGLVAGLVMGLMGWLRPGRRGRKA